MNLKQKAKDLKTEKVETPQKPETLVRDKIKKQIKNSETIRDRKTRIKIQREAPRQMQEQKQKWRMEIPVPKEVLKQELK
jgi:hypothetical protein